MAQDQRAEGQAVVDETAAVDAVEKSAVLAITSGGGYLELKGVVESLVHAIAPEAELSVEPTKGELLDEARSAGLLLGGAPLCLFGELSDAGREKFELRGPASVAELDLGVLVGAARMVATTHSLSSYPPVQRDLNVVFDESVRWSQIEAIARAEGGGLLESIAFQDDSYRDAAQLGEGKKSVVFRLQLRSMEGTLTGEAADAVVERVVAKLGAELGGGLRA